MLTLIVSWRPEYVTKQLQYLFLYACNHAKCNWYPKQEMSIISMLSEFLRGTGDKQSYVHPKNYAKKITLLCFDDNQGDIVC